MRASASWSNFDRETGFFGSSIDVSALRCLPGALRAVFQLQMLSHRAPLDLHEPDNFSTFVFSPQMASADGRFSFERRFLRFGDALLPHLHPGKEGSQAEGVRTNWQRTTLLVLAITLHNVAEGLAVGVAFGAAASGVEIAGAGTLGAAIALTIGIGLQNFPEGVAVSMPLRAEGMSRLRSFWYGQLSALVEPVAAVVAAASVLAVRPVLPYALAFAAGAMIYVMIEELIPESHREHSRADLSTLGALGGFTVMMILDVAPK